MTGMGNKKRGKVGREKIFMKKRGRERAGESRAGKRTRAWKKKKNGAGEYCRSKGQALVTKKGAMNPESDIGMGRGEAVKRP